jgi:hypothetical protein
MLININLESGSADMPKSYFCPVLAGGPLIWRATFLLPQHSACSAPLLHHTIGATSPKVIFWVVNSEFNNYFWTVNITRTTKDK